MKNAVNNYREWPDKRLKKAIERLKEKNQTWQQRFKHPNKTFLDLIKAFEAELTRRENENKSKVGE